MSGCYLGIDLGISGVRASVVGGWESIRVKGF